MVFSVFNAGVKPQVRYRGLAEDKEDELDSNMNLNPDQSQDLDQKQILSKTLLNHFRELASNDQDTDQVRVQETVVYTFRRKASKKLQSL